MEFNIGMMTSDMTQEVYYLQSSLQVLRCKATNPLVAKVDIFADWPLNISCKSLHAIQQSTFTVSFTSSYEYIGFSSNPKHNLGALPKYGLWLWLVG